MVMQHLTLIHPTLVMNRILCSPMCHMDGYVFFLSYVLMSVARMSILCFSVQRCKGEHNILFYQSCDTISTLLTTFITTQAKLIILALCVRACMCRPYPYRGSGALCPTQSRGRRYPAWDTPHCSAAPPCATYPRAHSPMLNQAD